MTKYERGLLEAIANDMIISDDSGEAWYWADHKIRLVAAEIESPQDRDENGYYCEMFADAENILTNFGYISNLGAIQ